MRFEVPHAWWRRMLCGSLGDRRDVREMSIAVERTAHESGRSHISGTACRDAEVRLHNEDQFFHIDGLEPTAFLVGQIGAQ